VTSIFGYESETGKLTFSVLSSLDLIGHLTPQLPQASDGVIVNGTGTPASTPWMDT